MPSGRLRDDGDAVAEHLGDRAEQILGGRQRVAAEVGERAAADRIVAEAERARRVGHVVLGVDAAVAADLAELARRDHLAREAEHRVAEIVEADLGLDPGRFRRVGHLAGVRGERRERLLAIDVLAGGDGRERHLLVQGVRRGDVDEVDLRDRRPACASRRVAAGEAERRRRLRRELVGAVGDGVQHELVGQVEDARRRGEAEDMGLAHEAGADQADPQGGLVTCH